MTQRRVHRELSMKVAAAAVLLLHLLGFVGSSRTSSSSSSSSKSNNNNVNDNEWMQVSPNVAFQRSNYITTTDNGDHKSRMDGAVDEAFHRMLSSSNYDNSLQRTGEEYNTYQLAWRLLGFYIDCNYNGGDEQCQRLVMYAVYVDPDYNGGGLDEYAFYDQSTDEFICYNYYGCRENMDCHLEKTNWQLLGVFKIKEISEDNGWMEQLFKHEGVCVWGKDTYKFASKMREQLPNQCKQSKTTDASGNALYYDVKPERNGNITVGLYTDSKCSLEYQGMDMDVFQVTGLSESYMDQFNEALDTWKICQPCIAYSIDASDSSFYCEDDAGYQNCNQCMKFSAKAGCQIASARDIALADRQQTIVSFDIYGTTLGAGGIGRESETSSRLSEVQIVTQESFLFAKMCFIFFMVCFAAFVSSADCKLNSRPRRRKRIKKETFLEGGGVDDDGLLRDVVVVEQLPPKRPKSPTRAIRPVFLGKKKRQLRNNKKKNSQQGGDLPVRQKEDLEDLVSFSSEDTTSNSSWELMEGTTPDSGDNAETRSVPKDLDGSSANKGVNVASKEPSPSGGKPIVAADGTATQGIVLEKQGSKDGSSTAAAAAASPDSSDVATHRGIQNDVEPTSAGVVKSNSSEASGGFVKLERTPTAKQNLEKEGDSKALDAQANGKPSESNTDGNLADMLISISRSISQNFAAAAAAATGGGGGGKAEQLNGTTKDQPILPLDALVENRISQQNVVVDPNQKEYKPPTSTAPSSLSGLKGRLGFVKKWFKGSKRGNATTT